MLAKIDNGHYFLPLSVNHSKLKSELHRSIFFARQFNLSRVKRHGPKIFYRENNSFAFHSHFRAVIEFEILIKWIFESGEYSASLWKLDF